jgi:hypothetical protein
MPLRGKERLTDQRGVRVFLRVSDAEGLWSKLKNHVGVKV